MGIEREATHIVKDLANHCGDQCCEAMDRALALVPHPDDKWRIASYAAGRALGRALMAAADCMDIDPADLARVVMQQMTDNVLGEIKGGENGR